MHVIAVRQLRQLSPLLFRLRQLSLLLFLVAVLGCQPSGLSGQGLVQFADGQPVMSGSIEFRSVDDGERYASRIQSDGQFDLQDKNGNLGIKPGQYEVVVVQMVLTEHLAASEHSHGQTVPRRYADYYTSGLQATIPDNHVPPIRIELAAE